MKKLFAIVAILSAIVRAQFPALSPYQPFQYFGFEHVIEANGIVVVYGPTYKSSIRLDASKVHNGDSSVVAFVTGAHGPVNCNTPGDSACQRHRAYTIQRFRGHKVELATDSTKYTGVALKSPIWTQFWYRYSNLPLYCHHTPDTGGCDWDSPATWCHDTTDDCNSPVTLARDSAGYIHWEHVPTFDSSTTTYQASISNDPLGLKQARSGVWHLIQAYLDNDSANGYAICWVDGKLHSSARVHGRNGTLAQFHAGLYTSSAVATGTVWNDDLLITHVPDTNYAILKYMSPQ